MPAWIQNCTCQINTDDSSRLCIAEILQVSAIPNARDTQCVALYKRHAHSQTRVDFQASKVPNKR